MRGEKGGGVTAPSPTRRERRPRMERPRKERRYECCGHRWSTHEPIRGWHTWCPGGATWWKAIAEWVTAVEEYQRACIEVASNLIGAGAIDYRRTCVEIASALVGAPTHNGTDVPPDEDGF
jgi:hypothetical protein